MIATQTFEAYPEFGNNATKIAPDSAKYAAGFQQSDVLPAEWMNWAWNHNTKGITDLNTGLRMVEQELNAILTAGGAVPDGTSAQVIDAIRYVIQTKTGILSDLNTTAKSNIVAAVNEILSALNTHKQDTNNPHEVTKEQVGLGNVPNVAPVAQGSRTSEAPIQAKAATGIAYGAICNTDATTQNKVATVPGFVLETGAVIRILFTEANSAANPTINISYDGTNYTGAKAIKAVKAGAKIAPPVHSGKWRGATAYTDEMWQPYTTLELMYDGTDWVIMGNPELENWSNDTEGYIVKANGYCEQTIKTNNSAAYTVNFPIVLTSTNYECYLCGVDCTNYGSWFGYAYGFSIKNKTASSVHVGKYANAGSSGYWMTIPATIAVCGY